jgi:hypothetical protein
MRLLEWARAGLKSGEVLRCKRRFSGLGDDWYLVMLLGRNEFGFILSRSVFFFYYEESRELRNMLILPVPG